MTSEDMIYKRRQLPKLMACMTKTSVENMRSKAMYGLDTLDAKGIRRRKLPLHECLVLELKETGYTESADYLQDLIYDNLQLLAEDDIGIVVDLRRREDYLNDICAGLQKAEKERDKENTKQECLELLHLGLWYSELGKGILWLAEKFFLAAIAVSSQYLLDGGRLKACCKYHYAKFLLDKFPGPDTDEPFQILTEVRDAANGKPWPLYEDGGDGDEPSITIFVATATQLHGLLLDQAKIVRSFDLAKSERLCRLAERRAIDADEQTKTAEAIIEMGISQLLMNNLNNALKTLERAYRIHEQTNNLQGLCEAKMHLSAVHQKLGDHETAARLLTEMGAMAMENGLRRQLGRALHLLGELHLRREKPELGTHHLAEAFTCFMGFGFQGASRLRLPTTKENERKESQKSQDHRSIYTFGQCEIFEEEAEQSRLMMAISAGQELMPSFFNLLREGSECAIARMKIMEWKLCNAGWWVKRYHHDYLPCSCQLHNRSPLDVLRTQLDMKEKMLADKSATEGLFRTSTTPDIRTLYSSYYVPSNLDNLDE